MVGADLSCLGNAQAFNVASRLAVIGGTSTCLMAVCRHGVCTSLCRCVCDMWVYVVGVTTCVAADVHHLHGFAIRMSPCQCGYT